MALILTDAHPDTFQSVMTQIHVLHNHYAQFIDTWILVFTRVLAFVVASPILGRQDIPFNIKLSFGFMLSLVFMNSLDTIPVHNNTEHWAVVHSENVILYTIQMFVNAVIGLVIGFIASMIMQTVNASGSLVTNQVGLSSAMTFDPSTKQQVTLIEKLFGFIALMLFFNLGGIYWLITALVRSFELFPLDLIQPNLTREISFDYLVRLSGNTLEIGTLLSAPIMMITIVVDLILGIVNRTAQQIQVFQLSFALKPCIGVGMLLITFPFFIHAVETYLNDFSRIY